MPKGLRRDRRQPMREPRIVAPDRLEVDVTDLTADRADAATADGPVVQLDDRRELHARPAQEHLVGDVDLAPIDRADLRLHAEGRGDLEYALAGDALEDVVRGRRRDEHAVTDHEE